MIDDAVEAAVQRIVSAGLAEPSQVVGCTQAEVAEVEVAAGGPLPGIYRLFLQRMGRSAGAFMRGTDVFYPEVLRLRRVANGLLQECGCKWQLGETAFVFSSHQGYQFLFFDRALGDDPPVLHYLEGDPGPREVATSFSSWLMGCAADEVGE